jgi:hypothetical protein
MINSINPRKEKKLMLQAWPLPANRVFLLPFSGLHKQEETIVNGLYIVLFSDTFSSGSPVEIQGHRKCTVTLPLFIYCHILQTPATVWIQRLPLLEMAVSKQIENIKKNKHASYIRKFSFFLCFEGATATALVLVILLLSVCF